MNELELISRARNHGEAVAIQSETNPRTYHELISGSAAFAGVLLDGATNGTSDLNESRVAYLIPAGFEYVVTQWAIWRAGGIAVPLSPSATESELEYSLTDSQTECVVTVRDKVESIAPLCERLGLRLLIIDDDSANEPESTLPSIDPQRRAMILYTSGTTSRPKGVVTTHANIQSQIESLIEAWQWNATDSIPLFLPLHHIHGIINIMSCALWSGATIDPFTHFDLATILQRVADKNYSVFMAVPTIYVKLIRTLESLDEHERTKIVDGFAAMRLMVSGSAALPASVHERWTELTGQKLLERYGMTEIGMALSNPYEGKRLPGAVGQPLPGVEIRLAPEESDAEINQSEGVPSGEIQVRGPSVFLEYWNRPEVTAESFDDGWFRTGDIAVCENGYYRIMGRQSVDIIKSGGYKLSALEIEAALLDHPAISECAVVGVADDTWGEAVAAAIVLTEGESLDLESLRSWCRDRISKYKIPSRLKVVNCLPRNAMGKVTKPEVVKLI